MIIDKAVLKKLTPDELEFLEQAPIPVPREIDNNSDSDTRVKALRNFLFVGRVCKPGDDELHVPSAVADYLERVGAAKVLGKVDLSGPPKALFINLYTHTKLSPGGYGLGVSQGQIFEEEIAKMEESGRLTDGHFFRRIVDAFRRVHEEPLGPACRRLTEEEAAAYKAASYSQRCRATVLLTPGQEGPGNPPACASVMEAIKRAVDEEKEAASIAAEAEAAARAMAAATVAVTVDGKAQSFPLRAFRSLLSKQ